MKLVIQRVSQASVVTEGAEIARIGKGMLVLIGAEKGDTPQQAEELARKTAQMRIFEDEKGKMNLSLTATGGEALVVSQFTLAAELHKGTRPGFDPAEEPEKARQLIALYVAALKASGVPVKEGRFGAQMEVSLINVGPVTFLL
jgi:D-tyrosyl-tRNA(Tyr) deacylase